MNNLVNISEAVSLGFHGMALIAREAPKRLNVGVVARELNASEAHLAKVFQTLSKAGLVSSLRGPAGGFVLNKAAEDVSFLDVYEILESPVQLRDCPMNYPVCGFHACIFEQKLNNINREILETFKNIKLSDFTTQENGAAPREDR